MDQQLKRHPSSYRDPSGFIFQHNNLFYRQVNTAYAENYDLLMSSGLFDALSQESSLLPHEEVDLGDTQSAYRYLLPEQLDFISYPYEWSFDMLKDAALLTLKIMKQSMKAGMVLKDATPFNLQLHKGKMIFIDTLSFEKYNEASPWIAYRQFCETFLAPLALMHFSRHSLSALLLAYPEGIPLALASRLLPWKSKFKLHLYLHLHLHARYSRKKNTDDSTAAFSRKKLENIIQSLELAIKGLRLKEEDTTWGHYYEEANLRNDYVSSKKESVATLLRELNDTGLALDLGGNDGTFSKLLAARGWKVICADGDQYAINQLYKDPDRGNIHPLILDFANPSPAIGFNNTERASFLDRCRPDLVLALALVHHLCIGRNIPLPDLAASFASLGKTLVIEFVPKEDPKVREILEYKKDIYDQYNQAEFENTFSKFFEIKKAVALKDSIRTLYHMERRSL